MFIYTIRPVVKRENLIMNHDYSMSFKTFKTYHMRPGHAAESRPHPQLQQTSKVIITITLQHCREAFENKNSKNISVLFFLKTPLTDCIANMKRHLLMTNVTPFCTFTALCQRALFNRAGKRTFAKFEVSQSRRKPLLESSPE